MAGERLCTMAAEGRVKLQHESTVGVHNSEKQVIKLMLQTQQETKAEKTNILRNEFAFSLLQKDKEVINRKM